MHFPELRTSAVQRCRSDLSQTFDMLSRMPIYEYLCADCSTEFEELVPLTTPVSVSCPDCGGGTVTKLLSSFATNRPEGAMVGGGGGCCGGSCGCGS